MKVNFIVFLCGGKSEKIFFDVDGAYTFFIYELDTGEC
jgi:hypothetical protein